MHRNPVRVLSPLYKKSREWPAPVVRQHWQLPPNLKEETHEAPRHHPARRRRGGVRPCAHQRERQRADPRDDAAAVREREGIALRLRRHPPKSKNGKASVGDTFAFNSPVFDQARTTRRGVLSVRCTVTSPGKESKAETECTGVFRLNDGMISLATTIKGSPKTVTAAVTGGTGAYVGARGSLTSMTVKGGSEDTITFAP
jgi:hypothetical protein